MSKVEQRTTRDGAPFVGGPTIRAALKPLTDAVHRLGERLDTAKRAEDARRAEREAHLESLVDEAAHNVHAKAARKHRQAKSDALFERITGDRPARTLREKLLGVDHPRPPQNLRERLLGVDHDDD